MEIPHRNRVGGGDRGGGRVRFLSSPLGSTKFEAVHCQHQRRSHYYPPSSMFPPPPFSSPLLPSATISPSPPSPCLISLPEFSFFSFPFFFLPLSLPLLFCQICFSLVLDETENVGFELFADSHSVAGDVFHLFLLALALPREMVSHCFWNSCINGFES